MLGMNLSMHGLDCSNLDYTAVNHQSIIGLLYCTPTAVLHGVYPTELYCTPTAVLHGVYATELYSLIIYSAALHYRSTSIYILMLMLATIADVAYRLQTRISICIKPPSLPCSAPELQSGIMRTVITM